MSENKKWDEYPPHTYERYKAFFEQTEGISVTITEGMWLGQAQSEWHPNYLQAKLNPPTEHTKASAMGPIHRENFLQNVKTLVCQDRNKTHGDAEDNFATIAKLWDTYLTAKADKTITALDVAQMMILFKVARAASNPTNLENLLDAAGYAACGGGIVMKGEKK